MKKLIFFLTFLSAVSAVQAQEINWMSMNEALEAQKKEPRKIFVDAYTTWCGRVNFWIKIPLGIKMLLTISINTIMP